MMMMMNDDVEYIAKQPVIQSTNQMQSVNRNQTNKQTNKQTIKQTNKQTNNQSINQSISHCFHYSILLDE